MSLNISGLRWDMPSKTRKKNFNDGFKKNDNLSASPKMDDYYSDANRENVEKSGNRASSEKIIMVVFGLIACLVGIMIFFAIFTFLFFL